MRHSRYYILGWFEKILTKKDIKVWSLFLFRSFFLLIIYIHYIYIIYIHIFDNFPDFFYMHFKIQYVIAMHLIKWLTNFYDFRFKWTATATIGIHPTKAWFSQLVNFKNASEREDTLEERYTIKVCFKNATETYGMLHTAFPTSCMNRVSVFEWHKRFKEGRESVKHDERCESSKDVNWPELIGQRVGLGIGLPCWGFKRVQEEIPSEEASTLQIGSVAFPPGQCTSPQLHLCLQTIWPRWASRQFFTLSIVQTLLPVTFGYSLSSEAVVMRQLRR